MPLAEYGYVPEATIIMFGCQPFTAAPGVVGHCPVCKAGVRPGDDSTVCAVCHSVSPATEARCRKARQVADGVTLRKDRKERVLAAEQKARMQLRAVVRKEGRLSERHRRWIWNGGLGSILHETPDVTNAAALGREFLRSIGQEPDWSIELRKFA